MSVAPIVGQGEAHRSIRTKRYTYVRNLEGPWLLFDDLQDPWQKNNLIEKAAHASLQRELDAELQDHLQKIGDDFRPPQSYIEEWGYELGQKNEIPYGMDAKVQSPSDKGGL